MTEARKLGQEAYWQRPTTFQSWPLSVNIKNFWGYLAEWTQKLTLFSEIGFVGGDIGAFGHKIPSPLDMLMTGTAWFSWRSNPLYCLVLTVVDFVGKLFVATMVGLAQIQSTAGFSRNCTLLDLLVLMMTGLARNLLMVTNGGSARKAMPMVQPKPHWWQQQWIW